MAENAREITEVWDKTDLKEEEQVEQARAIAEKRQEFKKELDQLGCKVCHASDGLIDVPVWHPHLSTVVHVCVSKTTSSYEDVVAHYVDEDWNNSRSFWEL